MNNYIGELAAIGTALCWSFCSICFTISSKRIGHNNVNRLRLTFALFFLLFAHRLIYGYFIPENIQVTHLFWFGISGVIGFVIGDRFLFKCFVYVGPRLGMLMMTLTPVFGIIIAWIFLHEELAFPKVIAIIVTLTGVGWVILERDKEKQEKGNYIFGIFLGAGAALCQAIGLIFSKIGLQEDFSALSGNIIRVTIAIVTIWIVPSIKGDLIPTFKKLKDQKASITLIFGSLLGPFAGVWLSLIAVQYAYIGIASTLMALPPVILLPLSSIIFHERITSRSIFGTLLALVGVTMIFIL